MSIEKSIIYSDLHGHTKILERVVDYYGNDVTHRPNGDSIDRGSDTKGTLGLLLEIGAEIELGNHEWAALAAMLEVDPERRKMWQEQVWDNPSETKRLEARTYESYGISMYKGREYRVQALKEAMQELGHLALLESGNLYYEDDDILLIHAGADDNKSWTAQRRELDAVASLARSHIFLSSPAQLFNFRLCDIDKPPKEIYQKTLITGHSHDRTPATSRVVKHGGVVQRPTRVRLASHLVAGDPLFVYETWTQQIRAFEQN